MDNRCTLEKKQDAGVRAAEKGAAEQSKYQGAGKLLTREAHELMIKHGMALKGSRGLALVTGKVNESDGVKKMEQIYLQSFT